MHGRHLKILGLSLLALVGVMAVSASAAQAKWLLLENGTSVSELLLEGTVLLGELKLVGLGGLKIHCEGGVAHATVRSLSGGLTLSGHAAVSFYGCTVLETTCWVTSPGQELGLIFALGEGEASMNGAEEVIVEASSEQFAEFEFTDDECPLNELRDKVNGSATLSLLEALQSQVTHLVHLDEKELFFGEEEVELFDPGLGEASAVLAHITTESGKPWAIHLVEL